VSVQAQILNLLQELQRKLNLAFVFITHDLSVIHHIGHQIEVMYLGKIVEEGNIEDIFYNTAHPYSTALLSARPAVNEAERQQKIVLEGEIPSPSNPPNGCAFHPRCTQELMEECRTIFPGPLELSETHKVYCWDVVRKQQEGKL